MFLCSLACAKKLELFSFKKYISFKLHLGLWNLTWVKISDLNQFFYTSDTANVRVKRDITMRTLHI